MNTSEEEFIKASSWLSHLIKNGAKVNVEYDDYCDYGYYYKIITCNDFFFNIVYSSKDGWKCSSSDGWVVVRNFEDFVDSVRKESKQEDVDIPCWAK